MLEEIIVRSDIIEGKNSIFCLGDYQRWLDKSCAGRPDPVFDLLLVSNQKFYSFPSSMTRITIEVKKIKVHFSLATKRVANLR